MVDVDVEAMATAVAGVDVEAVAGMDVEAAVAVAASMVPGTKFESRVCRHVVEVGRMVARRLEEGKR